MERKGVAHLEGSGQVVKEAVHPLSLSEAAGVVPRRRPVRRGRSQVASRLSLRVMSAQRTEPHQSPIGIKALEGAPPGSPPAPGTWCPRQPSVPDHVQGSTEQDVWMPGGSNPVMARGRGVSVPSLVAGAMKGGDRG